MSTNSKIMHNLPEFPYSPASDVRRHLCTLLSSSHFVTTVVSPPPLATPPPSLSCTNREDNADPSHTPPLKAEPSSAEIALHPSQNSKASACPDTLPVPIETHAPASAESRSVGTETARLKSSNNRQPPSQAYSFKPSAVLIGTGKECVTRASPQHRSIWRRFKRMGNRFVTPLRSIGLGFTSCMGGHHAVAFCGDLSSHDTSPGSSWYSSGEYPPDFIRAVLETNAFLGKLPVE